MVSAHLVQNVIMRGAERYKIIDEFQPTMLVAATANAVTVAKILRSYILARTGKTLDIYNKDLLHFNDTDHPLQATLDHTHEVATLSGQRILVVEAVDHSRSSLAEAIRTLQDTAAAAGGEPPVIGVFCVYNRRTAEKDAIPADILSKRFFVCEDTEDVEIKYPWDEEGHREPFKA